MIVRLIEGSLIMTKWITVILSIAGLCAGAVAVSRSKVVPPQVPLAREASINPFGKGIAALGIIEPAGRMVSVSVPEPGLVTEVLVQVGDVVKQGQPLLKLDSRKLESELETARAWIPLAEAEITRWRSLPRAEDLPPLRALIQAKKAEFAEKQIQLRINEDAFARGAATERDVAIRRALMEAAEADLARAQADYDKMVAGGWKPDLDLLIASLEQRKSEVRSLELLIDRLTVRAPRDGTVLRRQIEAGEYASADPARINLLLGDLSTLHVRAQVDEEDIALLASGDTASIRAMARTRGVVAKDMELRVIRIEPFARGKTVLSGENAERVDTRVIDVLLQFTTPPAVPLYPGQAVDVFIEK